MQISSEQVYALLSLLDNAATMAALRVAFAIERDALIGDLRREALGGQNQAKIVEYAARAAQMEGVEKAIRKAAGL